MPIKAYPRYGQYLGFLIDMIDAKDFSSIEAIIRVSCR